jgi:branched-chain amino acid transport system ATP-binding protein
VSEPLLLVEDLHVSYGPAVALRGVNVAVADGSILAVLGSNGAGKSSLARAVSGLVPSIGGRIVFRGDDITKWPAHKIRKAGLVHLPEGRGVLPNLSVGENIKLAVTLEPRPLRAAAMERAFAMFPVLKERQKLRAGSLSGGEQQMLSLARALAVEPSLVIADELSLGLAPLIVEMVFESLKTVKSTGTTIVLIEQFVHRALALSDDCVILRRGEVAWSGDASAAGAEVLSHYIGEGGDVPVG